MYKLYCRLYQFVMRLAANFLPWRKPELIVGEGAILKLPRIIKDLSIDRVIIVTDKGIVKAGLLEGFLDKLESIGIEYYVYDETVPNPTIDNIEEALTLYKDKELKGIVAFGGGSPIDCAKGIGARLARPDKSIPQMKGVLKVRAKMPTFFAVPTTSGTGSETTIAAVITDSTTHEKYGIGDLPLIPHYAVLDPLLTTNLPPHITSTTGIDALTHAVEAYIGLSNTKETERCAIESITLIFNNLVGAYKNGSDIVARSNMQRAAFLAGVAFTRAYVGYVHAIAHTLGGQYGLPHGLANAVILPYVLEAYGESAYRRIGELSVKTGIADKNDEGKIKVDKFIFKLKELNKILHIPDKLEGIKEEDFDMLVDRAYKEAHPLYPVPKILSKAEIKSIYLKIRSD